MKPNLTPEWKVPEPAEPEIQHAAYMLWVQAGRPEGKELDHWFAAKEMLSHHHGRDTTTRRRAAALHITPSKPLA